MRDRRETHLKMRTTRMSKSKRLKNNFLKMFRKLVSYLPIVMTTMKTPEKSPA